MTAPPAEIDLEIRPRRRYELIDVTGPIQARFGDFLTRYPRAVYASYHTTAGYLDERVCARLNYTLDPFIRAFQKLFPPDAPYQHDDMPRRSELSAEQRKIEPRNGDSHLTFIGCGLSSCVTYEHQEGKPIYFVDLDGVTDSECRCRRTTVMGFNREEPVGRFQVPLPVSGHPIDSLNLKSPRLGFFDRLVDLVRQSGVEKGRLDLSLASDERHAGLTVNEYETLLMQHDLLEVLQNPFRFMAQRGKHMLRDPRAIPTKTLAYATYDVVHVLNQLMDALGISESVLERILARCMAVPANHFLAMKRSVSLLVSAKAGEGNDGIVFGRYQSPMLVQWRKPAGQVRRLDVTLHALA